LYEKGCELVVQEVTRLETGVEAQQVPEIEAAAVALATEQQV